jgi:hypothetical protein
MPGAGQMYMGFMKRGLSLMAGFFLTIFLTYWLELNLFAFAIVIVWFYAFFDTFNLRALPDDEFYSTEDQFLLFPGLGKESAKLFQGKYRLFFALALIFVGVVILWKNVIELFEALLPQAIIEIVEGFGHYFPQLLVGLAIVALGIHLILGKKKELDAMDSMNQLEDKGGFQK